MKMKNGLLAAAVAAALVPGVASATAGLFGIAFGAKSMGSAGAGVAMPQDSIAAAINPAGMAFVGDSADLDVRFFSPIRDAELKTTGFGPGPATYDVHDQSSRELFVFPHFGFYKQLNSELTLGFTGYSNGGMNSNYDRNIYDEAFGAAAFGTPEGAGTPPGFFSNVGTLGIDYGQVVLAPTLAYKFHEDHSVGISALIGVQRLSVRGLGNFQGFTQTFVNTGLPSTKLTNNGSEWSYGLGGRVGWTGKVHPRVTLGAAYASKIYMTEFDDYEDLLAEDGDFDTAANLTLGAAFKVTPKVTLAVDYQRIFYGDVDSLSNDGPVAADFISGPSRPLGTDNGFGFGWDDIDVFKVGVVYEHNPKWTFRAGYHYNESPISNDEILFNILAPAVVQHHATAGLTYTLGNEAELSVAYMHAFEEEQDGITGFAGQPIPAEIGMYQNSLDIQYSWAF